MKAVAVLCLIVLAVSVDAGCYGKGAKRPSKAELRDKKKYTGAGAEPSPVRSDLPRDFDWCNNDGVSYCVPSWNQHIPEYCGACWVHGSLHGVNDRIKVLKGKAQAGGEIQVARQVILNCGKHHGLGNGCHGGEGFDVFEFMHRYGLPSESCMNYQAKESPVCNDYYVCQNCMPVGEPEVNKCWAVRNFTRYYVKEFGHLPAFDEAAIMSEIYARGPITCGFATNDDFDYEYFGGVYVDKRNSTEMDHDVEVVGWGETADGLKYWVARNSWGTYWGENGFFKIKRGSNNGLFESECVFAVPDLSDEENAINGKLVGGMYGLRPKPSDARREDGQNAEYTYALKARTRQGAAQFADSMHANKKENAASASESTTTQTTKDFNMVSDMKTENTQIQAASASKPDPKSSSSSKHASSSAASTDPAKATSAADAAPVESHVGVMVGVFIGCAAVLGLAIILYRTIKSGTIHTYEAI